MDPKLGSTSGHADAGVTLIELLVVVAIMSVLATGVTITALRPSPKAATSDHAWFERSFNTNRTLAIQGRTSRGLNVQSNGLVPVHMGKDGWVSAKSAHRWRGRVALSAARIVGASQGQPDIVFLSNGQTNPFDISFTSGQLQTLRCRSDGWTGLICDDA